MDASVQEQWALARRYEKRKNLLLVLSVLFDGIGMLSYFVPGLGELSDILWAPVSGFALYIMYGGYLGVFGGVFVFAEEAMPMTDLVPGFLIMWVLKYVVFAQKTKKAFFADQGMDAAHIQPAAPAGTLPVSG